MRGNPKHHQKQWGPSYQDRSGGQQYEYTDQEQPRGYQMHGQQEGDDYRNFQRPKDQMKYQGQGYIGFNNSRNYTAPSQKDLEPGFQGQSSSIYENDQNSNYNQQFNQNN